MQAFYSDHFALPLPDNHRFPMGKYTLLRERVMAAGVVLAENLHVPDAATDEQLLRVHAGDYIERVKAGALSSKEVRRIGFPWSPGLVERSRRSVGGTLGASRAALEDGIAVNLAGGTHHALRAEGSGYCVFNDTAIAARAMQAEGRARRVAIVDCDVHQGNGTAAIFAGDSSVFTFSIHGAKNFPFRKEQSDLDLGLADATGDEQYLGLLDEGLRRTLAQSNPDLVIYIAGADPYVGDRLGRLALSKAGLAQRDHLVFEQCRAAGAAVVVVMAGGYAREVDDIVDIHFETVRSAAQTCASPRAERNEKS